MSLSRDIVRHFGKLKTAAIPEVVLASARLHCLDAVGVGLAASALAQGEPYRRFVGAGQGCISLLTGGALNDPSSAALINGGLIHSLEFDDTHTGSIVHGSAVLLPVVIAMAQACDRSPQAALRAYLAGYEILIRLGLAAAGGFQKCGFQITSVAGTLVSALIAADMLGASEDEQVHAIGIALSQAAGVFEFLSNGSSVKSMHPGWAAHSGILAARLAMSGLKGPLTAIEGRNGLFAAFARDETAAARLHDLLGDLGVRWHMSDVAFKFLPCCHYLHPFVEAAASLAQEIVNPAGIAELILRIAPGAAPIVCEPWATKVDPVDGHSARWSLPVVVAARLIEGKVDLDTFKGKASPNVLALARRCRWEALEPNCFPQAFEAEIICRLVDGRMISARVADVIGNASRPASTEDVLAKFHNNASLCLPLTAARDVETFFIDPESEGFSDLSEALASRSRQEIR
jgi:2-methylcitrate dehydratase PrpD